MAVLESRATLPDAPPGPAFRPLAIGLASPAFLILGCRSCSRASGGTRVSASSLVIRPLVDHIDGDLHRGDAGALAGAALQDEEPALLDGELDVLHVAVVVFELLRDVGELLVDRGELVLELVDRLRGAHAGDDVFALRVLQELAEELVLAGGGVAGERNAGAGVVAHVAEDHRLNVDGGAEVVGDLLAVAVDDRALVVPALEDGDDGELELLHRVGGEVLAGDFLEVGLILRDQVLQAVGVDFGIDLRAELLL